jgi:hypothetical protein
MATKKVDSGSFGELNFAGAVLGDKRRTKRLVQLSERIAAHPEGTLPRKLGDPASYQAMYRLCKCRKVTHAAVLEPHRRRTLETMRACEDTVLVIHDTSELDYTSRTSLHDQLGQIGDGGGRGYECHNSLAVSARTGELLGLANQILHHRVDVPKNEGVAAKREREDRESRLWLLGSQAVGSPPPGREWVDVCDRGADTFEFLDDEARRDRQYVVRSNHNRAILVGHVDDPTQDPQRGFLHDYARSQEPIAGRVVSVPAGKGRKARRAKCLISIAPVRIRPPHNKRGDFRDEPLLVWVVRVWEIDAPADVEQPLEWILLTNVPTTSAADAIERIGWYERRWIIEDYHKGQKTGCGVESLQFDHVDRLEPMIALLSVVAVMLVNLRHAARQPDAATTPAATCVPVAHIAVLSVWRYRERRVELTVHEFFMALGRLGGHQNRKSDGPPGWITLWRGWNQLQHMVDYAIKAGVEKM